jgi:hypothetical protein
MTRDGRTDFDFLRGRWHVHNRKLNDLRPRAQAVWREFTSAVESRSILGGLGTCDDHHFADFPGRGEYHGFAFRLFDPVEAVWRIWWASHPGSGTLDPPLVGRFEDGEGRFAGVDVFDERPISVRFKWSDITAVSARWEQSFAFDGSDFIINWTMEFERVGGLEDVTAE